MSRTPPIPPAAVDALRRTVDGLVAYPTDPAYDDLVPAVAANPGERPARPGVVVVPATETAVGAAVDVARAHGLRVGVDAGDGRAEMLVLTHRLDGVVVDPPARTATVGAGVTWDALRAHSADAGIEAQVPYAVADPGTGVVAAARAGIVDALSARVVRADGFVHVVDGPRPDGDRVGPWIVTAVVVRLGSPITSIPHTTHTAHTASIAHTERIPS